MTPSVSPSTRRLLVVASALALLALLLAGCASGRSTTPEAGPATTAVPEDPAPRAESEMIAALSAFNPIDTRGVELPPVPGTDPSDEATEVGILGGQAELRGVVLQGGTGVEGATVELVRYVDGRSASEQFTSGADGVWSSGGIRGGRYVIRAWKSPSAALDTAESVFLSEDQTLDLSLAMVDVPVGGGLTVSASVDDPSPVVGQTVTILVSAERTLRSGSSAPVVGAAVVLTTADTWELTNGSVGSTNAEGIAAFPAVCRAEGSHSIAVQIDDGVQDILLPTCSSAAEDAPEDEADDGSDDEADKESEDKADEPDVAAVGVGATVSVPYSGALPAGTYESGDEQFCETMYDRWVDGEWESSPQVARGWSLNSSTVLGNLRAAPGSESCTYERTA